MNVNCQKEKFQKRREMKKGKDVTVGLDSVES